MHITFTEISLTIHLFVFIVRKTEVFLIIPEVSLIIPEVSLIIPEVFLTNKVRKALKSQRFFRGDNIYITYNTILILLQGMRIPLF